MDSKVITIKVGIAAALTALANLLGGADVWLYTLIGFTIVDFFTGILKAILTKTMHLDALYKGGVRKLLIYVTVGVATALDSLLLEDAPILRNIAMGYYVATEGLSILENIALCGIPFPKKLRETMLKLKSDNDQEDT